MISKNNSIIIIILQVKKMNFLSKLLGFYLSKKINHKNHNSHINPEIKHGLLPIKILMTAKINLNKWIKPNLI